MLGRGHSPRGGRHNTATKQRIQSLNKNTGQRVLLKAWNLLGRYWEHVVTYKMIPQSVWSFCVWSFGTDIEESDHSPNEVNKTVVGQTQLELSISFNMHIYTIHAMCFCVCLF